MYKNIMFKSINQVDVARAPRSQRPSSGIASHFVFSVASINVTRQTLMSHTVCASRRP